MPDYATSQEHAQAAHNPATRYVAVNRAVMLGQVFICRAPSHEKAKKLARLFMAFSAMLRTLKEWKCPSCGGDGFYSGYSSDAPKGRACRKCGGSGLHPMAKSVLDQAEAV